MKKTFNEKVSDLRTQKIRLIHEYKQFKFDISMIQKKLNDPEIITPSDFPEVLMDESIDVRNILHKAVVKYYYYKIFALLLFNFYRVLLLAITMVRL